MASAQIPALFDVRGRVALVTGGSSGIGFMISQGLVQNGCKVYVCGLSSDPIDERVKELKELGAADVIGFPGDVSTKEGVAAIAQFVSARETHLDILVSNAGVRRDAPMPCPSPGPSLAELQASLWSHEWEEGWVASFRVNTAAHFFLAVALLPLLAAAADLDLGGGEGGAEADGDGDGGSGDGQRKTRSGRRKGRDEGRGVVVVTSSCASMHNCTNVDLMSYATTKAATDHLVALLASKFARWYVRVNAINPGFVPSQMNPIGAQDNMFANLIDKVPAKRVGNMEDLAGTVIYLCSQAGSYVDGRCLCLDGGRVLFANGQE
ncbi:short chain dehydrogenase [Xylariaceae sp. FL0804]|nr:short chain dehydrogenase [Xylariaceae sp. FL0804]